MIFYETGTHKANGFKHDPFKAFVSPRPIGWVGTVDSQGRSNIAPYSFFNAVAYAPPIVAFGSGRASDGGPKDSQRNVEETGDFTLSIVSHDIRNEMNTTALHLPHGESEFDAASLEALPSKLIKSPGVAASPIVMECKYLQTVDLPGSNALILGQVVAFHVREDIVVDGMVDVTKYKPVARLGYFDYTTVENVYEIMRPD